MDTIKILNKLVDKLKDLKDEPATLYIGSDIGYYMTGCNDGLDQSILLLEEEIKTLESQLNCPPIRADEVDGVF